MHATANDTDLVPATADDRPADAPPVAPAAAAASFEPVAAQQRIEALDVVRGFALLGIFLMNIEFFNRSFASFGEGMPRGLTGLDWLASWFVAYFVQGKFWTIFSLLFGMGFAVMLVRAERAGRAGPGFMKMYLRRILALATFGGVHFIFIWDGDILFSYAVGALALLIVLFGKPKPLLLAIAVFAGLGFLPEAKGFFAVAGGLAATGLLALYLRREKLVRLGGRSLPMFSLVLMAIGAAVSVAAVVFWLLPDGPIEPRWPLTVTGPLLLLAGWLSWKYHQPADKRSVRLAVAIYVASAVAMTGAGLAQYFAPDPAAIGAATEKAADATAAAATGAPPAAARPASTAVAKAAVKPADKAKAAVAEEPKKTKAERAAEMREERAKRLAEGAADKAREVAVFTTGSYADTVDWHARRFLEKVAGDAGFAVGLVGMFLLGMWFVRSGVMENTAGHLPFFRKLAFVALPLGIGLGLLGSLIAMSHTPGDRGDGWGIARGIQTLGNLPACLGYVGMVVLMLHSNSVLARIRVLAPLGRMALTNYLTQSIICAVYFYGYGLGHWGLSRSGQVLFVAVVYALQIAFSHWWLARFRYGPMEWVWRGFTYRQVPPLRIAAAGAPVTAEASSQA